MDKLGLIHIYAGYGKGKTTASIGLSVRAKGAGLRVLIAQFLKGQDTSELGPLATLGIEVARTEKVLKFISAMTPEEKESCRQSCIALLDRVQTAVEENSYDLIVLDEVLDAVNLGMVPAEMLEALCEKNGSTELVLTGRNPSERLVELADYYTAMDPIKHPYEQGITARTGIEH